VPSSPPPHPPKGIALFDLDGTLLPWDCQLLFRYYVIRKEPWRILFLPIFLLSLPFALWLKKNRLKRIFITFIYGIPTQRLEQYATEFAAWIQPAMYQEVLTLLEKHRLDGDLLILSSASPECYVLEIGKSLGFHLTFGTILENRNLFPKLTNHKGDEKVRRLYRSLPMDHFMGNQLTRCHGYTDSCADLPMLALCQTATVVNPSPKLTAIAEQNHWHIIRPQRPWSHRLGFAWRATALLFGLGSNPASIPPHQSIQP